MRAVVAIVISLVVVTRVLAQERPDFLERARTGTARYQDQSNAVLDGYRRIGRDFPAMGEHWIRINLLFDGKIEPERPEFLTYVNVGDKPVLLGVAYALPLLPGESPPSQPAPMEAWHDHLRTVEDETVLPQHHFHMVDSGKPRLAMLHAWIWTSNPEGVFAADNWAIPYVRLGIVAPRNVSLPVARALSLLSGGTEFFSMSIDAAVTLTAREQTAVRGLLERARSTVEDSVRSGDLDKLGDHWTGLSASIEAAVSPQSRASLQAILR